MSWAISYSEYIEEYYMKFGQGEQELCKAGKGKRDNFFFTKLKLMSKT